MVAVAQQASGQSGCRPVVKWVGGKGRLVPQLLARAPQRFDRYFEPFAGGAALFFALRPARAVLGDANQELIATYAAVRNDVEAVIAALEAHTQRHDEEWFYRVRERWNAGTAWHPADRAADFLYLNRAGFNGLYRVNKAGRLNVPFGKAESVSFDLDNLRAASRALQGVELRAGSYEHTLAGATAGDFVYLDPPYDRTFNAYTADAFDQGLLALTVHDLVRRGCHVLLSNSDTPRIRELYADFALEVVRSPRSVNADGAGRGDVDELLISGKAKNERVFIAGRAEPGGVGSPQGARENVTGSGNQAVLPQLRGRGAQGRAGLHEPGLRPVPASTVQEQTMSEQTSIPGTEPPDEIEAIKVAINEWLDAKTAQKRAADESKVKHQTIVALYAEHGIEHHTYTCPKTGKPKRLWLKKEPKATSTSIAVTRKKKERRGGADREADAEIVTPEEKVEFRRVPRASVEKEVDGFASIRERMEAKADEKGKGKGK